MSRDRATYGDCGRMMRSVLGRAHADDGLTLTDLRVLNAVLMSTVSWSVLEDTTTRKNLAALAFGVELDEVSGWQRKRVQEALVRLAKRGHVVARSSGRGLNARVNVSFEKTPEIGVSELEKTPDSRGEDPRVATEKTPDFAAHREVTEDLTEPDERFIPNWKDVKAPLYVVPTIDEAIA